MADGRHGDALCRGGHRRCPRPPLVNRGGREVALVGWPGLASEASWAIWPKGKGAFFTFFVSDLFLFLFIYLHLNLVEVK